MLKRAAERKVVTLCHVAESFPGCVTQDGTDDAALGAPVPAGVEIGKEARYAESGEDVIDALR